GRRYRLNRQALKRWATRTLAVVLVMVSPLLAGAGEPLGQHKRVAVLEQALADFDSGLSLLESEPDRAAELLQASADGFETLIDGGVENGRLHYNLGNAYLQLGELGLAIANYRRAEKLIPGDAQLETNLEYARGLRRNQLAATGGKTLLHTLFFWHYRVPLPTRFLCGVVLYVLFWLVLIIRPFLRQVGLRLVAAVLAIGWIVLGVSTVVEWRVQAQTVAGVIVNNEVVVRKGNSANYEPQFKQMLYEGVEFTLIERRGAWLRIELPDGGTGWVRTDQVELI
ncbi:MAG: hypothetical protein KAV82_10360, partial [Phycisphaerae bacterium]|nr:hypothetical protein [Phycisphaerae bacterium]